MHKHVAPLTIAFVVTVYGAFWLGKQPTPRAWYIDASLLLCIIALCCQVFAIAYLLIEKPEDND